MQSSKQGGRAEQHAKSPHAEGRRDERCCCCFYEKDCLHLQQSPRGGRGCGWVKTFALQPLNHAVCSGVVTWSKVPKFCIGVQQALGRLHYKANQWLWLAVGDAPTPQPRWVEWTDGRWWVVRIVSLISILPRGSNSECR
jgi:hypothetical protein